MTTINDCFARFIVEITPSDKRVADVKDACSKVRSYLRESGGFETVEPTTLLIGSYKRHTAVKDIHDVDLLVFPAGDEVGSTPSEVLNRLRVAMEAMPESRKSTRSQNRSVRITMYDDSMDVDIVPAFNHVEGNKEPLRIPDREAGSWVETNPLLYGAMLTELNKSHDSRVLPMIRMAKLWRDNAFGGVDAPKSFWLEAMLYGLIAGGEIDLGGGYQRAMCDLFDSVSAQIRTAVEDGAEPCIVDPGLERSVRTDWGLDRWVSFAEKAERSLVLAREAVSSDDFEVQFDRWGRVFGEDWPALRDVEDEVRVAEAVVSGTATVSAAGALQIAGKGRRVPPVRAYGE